MSRFLTFAVLFCPVAIVAGVLGSWAAIKARRKTTTLAVALVPDDGRSQTPEGTAAKAAEILRRRVELFRRRHSVAVSSVEVIDGNRLSLALTSHLDVEPLLERVLKRCAVELRLVGDEKLAEAALAGDPPEGYEVLYEKQYLYDLHEIGELKEHRTPFLVRKQPELVLTSFRSVNFSTHGLRRDTVITIEMHPDDARRFATVTEANVGKRLAVVIDGEIRTAPKIMMPLTDGRAEIRGIRHRQSARDLAALLRIGALPCRVVRQRRAEPVPSTSDS